jgi:CTP synthase (UTP-ammonia lyase)
MDREINVGIIGDYNPQMSHHIATDESLVHAASALSCTVSSSWVPTESLAKGGVETTLDPFDAIWCGPGSPYKSMDGALQAIRFAREQRRPFIGT